MWWSEFVATFGLIGVAMGTARSRPALVPLVVAAYIMAGYWFTASSAFANPALTLACALTAGFSGIRAADVPAFVLAQLAGALARRWCSTGCARRVGATRHRARHRARHQARHGTWPHARLPAPIELDAEYRSRVLRGRASAGAVKAIPSTSVARL